MLRKLFGSGKKHSLEEGAKKIGRFTKAMQRVLLEAQHEAERRQDRYIRDEHLLLALLREEQSVAGKVLRNLGPKPETFESVLKEMAATPEALTGQPELSKEVKRVLELTVDEARRMEHHWIGTQHLLTSLLRQENTVAHNALIRLGFTRANILENVQQIARDMPVTPEGKPALEETR
jgi:ATP-dependent Clp protease ATP-binding subunit ClpC